MKPKKREEQTQSSRMYLHRADHREAVYNDMYHNAMWANTEDVDDELVWVKYPKNAMMFIYGGDGSRAGGMCWMDIDRQFQFGTGQGGGQAGRALTLALECGITVCISFYGTWTTIYVTEDGIVYQYFYLQNMWPENGGFQSLNHFGEDGLCIIGEGPYVYEPGGYGKKYYNFYTWIFEKNEETKKWEINVNRYTILPSVGTYYNYLTFVGNTKQGCIIMECFYDYNYGDIRNHVTYIHIDHAGIKTIKNDIPQDKYALFYPQGMGFCHAYCKVGNRCYFVTSNNYVQNAGTTDLYRLIVGYTDDRGESFTAQTLEETTFDRLGQYNYIQAQFKFFACSGEVFIYYAIDHIDNKRCKAFSIPVSGGSWSEIILPSWLEVPIISSGGVCVASTSKETLKIAINPPVTSDYDLTMWSMMTQQSYRPWDMALRSGGILYQDGKLVDTVDSEFYVTFGEGWPTNWIAFFDNKYLAENSRAFAWKVDYFSTDKQTPDMLQNGDYCVPYESQTFDPYQYPFWDYYKWDSIDAQYVKVPRVTLSQYSNWHVIVVEYLPTVGANSVLYKVPRQNV